MRTTVTDVWGARWTVRAREVRGTGTVPPRAGPDVDRMRRRLDAALGQHPAPLGPEVPTDIREPAAPVSDPVDAELSAFRRGEGRPGTRLWALGRTGWLLRMAVAHLRTPRSGTWEVELLARGRFRRWARWQVRGEEAAARALTTVAADLTAGRVPQPDGGTLVEVVDHRPPFRPQQVA
ncbi:hypothetical protein [Blastococcus sp. SYSU D01042]